MSNNASSSTWVTKRSHLQISENNVLPVVFRSRKSSVRPLKDRINKVPPAFARTEVELSDSFELLLNWLAEHIERLYRVGAMNSKPGALETPDILRTGNKMFTVWLEPTAATYALLLPSEHVVARSKSNSDCSTEEDKGQKGDFNHFSPTPQTLHIVAELDA